MSDSAEAESVPLPSFTRFLPDDVSNRILESHAHPAGWENPVPQGRYNLVVLGGGTAGLVCAAGAAGLGAKVALIERHLLGGDCLNFGCVPSKALIRSARAAHEVRRAGDFGVRVPGPIEVDFPAVMRRMRDLRARIAPHDGANRFRSLGVDVYLGDARFTGPTSVVVDGQTLRFSRAVITTGARAASLDLPGIERLVPLTNETVFNLTELPRRLAVIGAGPIGCEMSQTFARLGSRVILLANSPRILPRDDSEAATLVQQQFEAEGIRVECGVRVTGSEIVEGQKFLLVEKQGQTERLPVDALLVAVGRRPNVENLGLEQAGVDFNDTGVQVNDFLQTTNRRIYAAGDVCSPYRFTHAADAMARIVLRNALFFGWARMSRLVIPWCTYTDPEVAHVGLTAEDAARRNLRVDTFTVPLSGIDRAILEGEADSPGGFARIRVRQGTGQMLGATLVSRHAGEMIGEVVLALTRRLGLSALSGTILPYPTVAESLKRLGDAYQKTRLTPWVAWLLRTLLVWGR